MTENQTIHQPNLFDQKSEGAKIETVLLYALGEFQSRGKVLANRELALDRLRGAFKRASEKFAVGEFSDEELAKSLEKLGSKVVKVPNFVAKHPFRVTVLNDLADKARVFYKESLEND
jgi:signal recognition particle subunit SEC65